MRLLDTLLHRRRTPAAATVTAADKAPRLSDDDRDRLAVSTEHIARVCPVIASDITRDHVAVTVRAHINYNDRLAVVTPTTRDETTTQTVHVAVFRDEGRRVHKHRSRVTIAETGVVLTDVWVQWMTTTA